MITGGERGVRSITYRVTYKDGVATSRRVLDKKITSRPVDEVTAVGTRKPAPPPQARGTGCDPNYSGGCVPIESDVDCAGGSGNGPSYVRGPVNVIGTDIYRLDANHNGQGCEQ